MKKQILFSVIFFLLVFFPKGTINCYVFKANDIPILYSVDNYCCNQYILFWNYFFRHFNGKNSVTETYEQRNIFNKKNFTVVPPFPHYQDIEVLSTLAAKSFVFDRKGNIALMKKSLFFYGLFESLYSYSWLLFSPTFDRKGRVIDVDTFFYGSQQIPFSLFFPSLINEGKYFQLNYELDTNSAISYFKIKTFVEDSASGGVIKLKEKIIYDPYSIKDPGFIFLRNIKPDSVKLYRPPGLFPSIKMLRGENNREWWVFKFYSRSCFSSNGNYFLTTDSGPAVTTIALYKFTDDDKDSIELKPIKVCKFRPNKDTLFYPGNVDMYFSPNLDLALFLTVDRITFSRRFFHLHFLRFDRERGDFLPIDGVDSMGGSYVDFFYNIDSIPDTTNILDIPFLAENFITVFHNGLPAIYSLLPIPFFSNDGKRIYVFRWQINLDSLNINYIKSNVRQWLPNEYTSLDIYQRLRATRKTIFLNQPEYFVGLMGSPLFYSFFPTYTGKWYLMTFSFADSLSPSFLRSKPIYSTYALRLYELKNMDSLADKITINLIRIDTLIYPRAPANDSDYVPYVPPFTDSLIFPTFFQNFFSPNEINIYFEYFYPPRGVLALGPSEVCEGEEIHLEGRMHLYPDTFAQYYWYGPNGWQDTGRIVIIRNAQINNSGKYICKAVFADTTFSSEVYVQVVPRPKITFERAVPRYICNGEPYTVRITFPRWGRQNYWILWSTGDTVEAVTIGNSGEYWVKVWDENGCTDSVGFKVEYVDTAEVRILKEKEYICTGERIWLEVEEGWDSIQWSTGGTSRRIYVERGGNYRVEVRNRFGCVAQGETTVEEVNLELELPNLVDFGRVHLWTTEERRVGIVNTSGRRITGSINYVGSEEIEVEPRGRFAIDVGDSIEIVGKCRAKGYGLKEGKVMVEVDSPCVKIWEIEMQGRGTGVVKVWTIDSVVVVGEKDFCIPIYSKVEVGGEDTVMGWQGEVVFERGLMATGEGSIVGEERVVKFSGEVKMDTMVKEIGRICGDILLPERRVVAIDLRGFEFGENYEVNEEDGRLMVVGVCEPELSQVEMRNVLRLTIIPNPAGEKFKFRIEGERGKEYKIRINDLLGKSIEEVEGKFEGSEVEIEFEGKELGKGMFFGQLCSGGECVIQAFWIW